MTGDGDYRAALVESSAALRAGDGRRAVKLLEAARHAATMQRDEEALLEVLARCRHVMDSTRGNVRRRAGTTERLTTESLKWVRHPAGIEGPRIAPEVYEAAVAVISGCRVLGGSGLPAEVGEVWDLVFTPEVLELFGPAAKDATVEYSEIVAIEIGGRGETKRGGGFVGGGFGLEAAAEGMLIASALNMLTTTTSIDTVVCLQTHDAELFLHNDAVIPEVLRVRLSRVFTRLRQLTRAQNALVSPVGIAAELERLATLHASGALSDDEFAAAKAKLLA